MATIIDVQTDLQKLTNKKITYTAIGKVLGTGKANISLRAKTKSQVTPKELSLLESAYKVRLSDNIRDQILQVYRDFKDIKQNFEAGLNEFVNLPVKSEVNASMGYGVEVINENQTGTYAFSKKLLSDIGANPKYSDVIFGSGNSMEPTIYGGDALLVDKSRREINDGRIYCIRQDGQLKIKRLQKLSKTKLKIISDNKDYEPITLDFTKDTDEDFEVIGEIRWCGRVFL